MRKTQDSTALRQDILEKKEGAGSARPNPHKTADIIQFVPPRDADAGELPVMPELANETTHISATNELDVTSDAGLGHIVRRLSDLLLLTADEIPPQVLSLTDQALSGLVDQLDVKTRYHLASRVAKSSEMPQLLIRRLVFDCEAVAQPILESGHFLSDVLQSRLAMKAGQGHRELLARRADLTTMATNILVSREERPVVTALLENRFITLDSSTVDLVIEKFASFPEILELLAERSDIQPRHGFDLFWHLNAERRLKVLSRFAISRRQLRESAEDLIALIDRDLSLRSHEVKRSLRLAFGPIAQLEESDARGELDIDTNNLDQMLLVIRKRSRISRKVFAKILSDQGGEPLAVLCKAVSIKKPDFICLARVMHKVLGPKKKLEPFLDHVAEVYDRLSWDGADMALRHWDDSEKLNEE